MGYKYPKAQKLAVGHIGQTGLLGKTSRCPQIGQTGLAVTTAKAFYTHPYLTQRIRQSLLDDLKPFSSLRGISQGKTLIGQLSALFVFVN